MIHVVAGTLQESQRLVENKVYPKIMMLFVRSFERQSNLSILQIIPNFQSWNCD